MKPSSLQQIRQAVGGKSLAPLPSDSPKVSVVCTDTRKRIEPGSLFVALPGEHFDGHQFLPKAAAEGAVAALVEQPPADPWPNLHLIQVPSTRAALGKLATYARKQMRAKVIGVAGSNGKTSTKHLIQAALSGRLKGSISPKSYNNDIGVPLTILPADPLQDYLVLEMGTNHHGEISVLTKMALPDIAVITNCGAEHLEGLGDLMGVRRENATVLEGVDEEKGLLVVNGDDDELLQAVSHWPGKRLTFGFKHTNDLFATDIEVTDKGVYFSLNNSRRQVFVPLLGKHTACNALAAIAVARKMAVPEDVIIDGLSKATGPEMRLQLQKISGITLVNDAYNANPNSMRAALETVMSLSAPGRRIAILGDMRELGQSSDRFHRELGELAATCRLDALVCVGAQAALIADAAERAGMAAQAVSRFEDSESAAKVVPTWLHDGDLVLLKGSRGIRLEAVANAMQQAQANARRKVAS